jgi:26S proteasome regulatory subunit N6
LDIFDERGDESSLSIEIELTKDLLNWCERDKRAFLKQSLQIRLASLYHKLALYSDAITLINELIRDLKRLDDKMALIEVHLLESKVYFALKNIAKARASLTASRTHSNSLYTPPLLQASLDIQAGLIFAEETDFKTAFSYFIEALDNYVSAQHNPIGLTALKYMLLCKIMIGQVDDVEVILSGKMGQYYPGTWSDIEAMKAVAESCKKKSLKAFEECLVKYPKGNFKRSLDFCYICFFKKKNRIGSRSNCSKSLCFSL